MSPPVPGRRRPAFVEHLLAFLEPGGRLIVGKYNEETGSDDLAAAVESWGQRISGRATRPHVHPALSYKALWVDRDR